MKFNIGNVEVRIFDMDIAKGHVRASINFPVMGHEIMLAGEYEKESGKPFYMSVEVDKVGDKDNED